MRFFYIRDEDFDHRKTVQEHMRCIMRQDNEDTFTYAASISEQRSSAVASMKEELFRDSIKNVKHYAAEGNSIKWRETLMHSSELEDIIEMRLALWNSNRRNSDIAFLLANNYQEYALEYQHQERSADTVLYYYVESIIWSERALSYEQADKGKIFKYIKGRYKDIADYAYAPDSIRKVALAIYNSMGKYSDYIK